MVDTSCDTSLEQTFPSIHQYQIASWLGVGICVHFSFSVLEFHLVCTCAGLTSAAIVSVTSYVPLSCCVLKTLCHPSHPAFIVFLPPLLYRSLYLSEVLGRGLIRTSHLGLMAPMSSVSAHGLVDHLSANLYLLQEKASMKVITLIRGFSNVSLEVILLLYVVEII